MSDVPALSSQGAPTTIRSPSTATAVPASESGCNVQAFTSYDTARDRRNYFYWLTGVTVFISMFDAYADAYLLTLERTRNEGDDYWGGHASLAPRDEWRLVATLKW